MRPIPKHIASACSSVLLIAVAAGCGSDAKSSTSSTVVTSVGTTATELTVSSTVVTSVGTTATELTVAAPGQAVTVPPASAAATPTGDPCDLLTAAVASQALGVPVGDKITQTGQGNTTCGYRPADPAAKGFVSLTLYAVTGSEAVLDAAATQFPDAESVDGVGDSARLSIQTQAIGVLTGSTVFALGLFPQQPDGQLVPITKDQLITVARAVLAGH